MTTVTLHAHRRWCERFPGRDMMAEFARASLVGKKTKRKILARCPSHAKYCTKRYEGRYFLMTREMIVFVVTATPQEEKIITVFDISC